MNKKKTTIFLKSASSWTWDDCEGSFKTDRIMLFWATPREPHYILHNDKLPNSCYDFQFSGAHPTEYCHIFLSLTHFKPMLYFYTSCKRYKNRGFLENGLITECLNRYAVRIILFSLQRMRITWEYGINRVMESV